MSTIESIKRDDCFEQLMAELAAGSEDAAWKIAETYTPHILRVVRSSLPAAIRPKLDSQDFAQIVWASLLLKRSYLSHVKSPEQLIGLLASVAQHKVIDAYRHYTECQMRDLRKESPIEQHLRPAKKGARVYYEAGLLDRGLSPSQIVGTREKWKAILNKLSTREREVLRLRLKGDTYDQIAKSVEMSSATVRRILASVIDQLRA